MRTGTPVAPSTGKARSRRLWRGVARVARRHRRTLISYLWENRQWVERGVYASQPRRAPDLGAMPEPFAASTERARWPLSTREAPSGLRSAPAGLRGTRGARGEGERRRGAWR